VTGNAEVAEEPIDALVGGNDGLKLIRELVADLPRVLAPSAAIGLEIDPSQSSTVAALV
jgi:methylase of polypeptide subunit release factors